MDRRAALQKLAAGGLIAAGTPLVLDARRVAAAASGPVPPPAEDFTVAAELNGDAQLTIVDAAFPSGTQFSWTGPPTWPLQPVGDGTSVVVQPPPGNYVEQTATFTFTASTIDGYYYEVVVFVDMKGNGNNFKAFQFLRLTGPHQA